MNKKIWLTGALSILVIFATVFVYNNFIMEKPAEQPPLEEAPAAAVQSAPSTYIPVTGAPAVRLGYETDVFTAEFSSEGGRLVSLRLNGFTDSSGEPVEMINSESSGLYPFSIHPGGFESPALGGSYKGKVSGSEVVFTGDFTDEDGELFTVTKRYGFKPGSYMISFNITIEAAEGRLPLGDGKYMYSLGFGPQLGPHFEKLDRGYVYRYFNLNEAGVKRNLAAPAEEGFLALETPYLWLGIESRYFTCLTIPETAPGIRPGMSGRPRTFQEKLILCPEAR